MYAIFSAIYASNQLWYSSFAIGATLWLGYVNYRLGIASVLFDVAARRRWLLLAFGAYVLAAIGIELVLRFWLGFVYYPSLSIADQIVHLVLIQYAIGFFYIYEFYAIVRHWLKSAVLALLISSLINGFTIEYLNTFSWEWRYNVPFAPYELFQVNVLAVFGWIIMAIIPIALRLSVDAVEQRRRSI